MEYDPTKVEEAVLALLGAFEFERGRVWKRYDFEVMGALHEKGYITSPHGRSESVHLTELGLQIAKRLAQKNFGRPAHQSSD